MRSVIRKIRGGLGLALLWALAWGAFGAVLHGAMGLWYRFTLDTPGVTVVWWSAPVVGGIAWAAIGFFHGVVFSLLLAIAMARRTLGDIRGWQFGLCGALTGGVSLLIGTTIGSLAAASPAGVAVAVASSVLLGGVSAIASLLMARKGEEFERLGAGDEAGPVVVREELLGG